VAILPLATGGFVLTAAWLFWTQSVLLGSAMSLDRLEVEYRRDGRTCSLLISPADQHNFLLALRSAEPALELGRDGLERRP
jgi:hypothetical protein